MKSEVTKRYVSELPQKYYRFLFDKAPISRAIIRSQNKVSTLLHIWKVALTAEMKAIPQTTTVEGLETLTKFFV